MATTATAPRTSYDEWRTCRWRLTGLAFALLWLVTAVAVVIAGERQSDLGSLESGIASGAVAHVEVVGFRDFADWQGRTTITLKWRGSVLARYADVEVDTRRSSRTSPDGARIIGDPADYLRAYAPDRDLDVTYSDRTGYQEWHGWRGRDVPVVLGLATWFGTVLLAGAGPRPWRATQWAWIWLILFGGPLGSVAFLLLGGPLGLWRPRDLSRRLTGGWAFLIGLVFLGGDNAP